MVRSLSHWRKTFSFPSAIQQQAKKCIKEQPSDTISNINKKNLTLNENNEFCTILNNNKEHSEMMNSTSASTTSINEPNMPQQVYYRPRL